MPSTPQTAPSLPPYNYLHSSHLVHIMNSPIITDIGTDTDTGTGMLAEIRSSSPDEDIDLLRQRLAEDGYLCLRGLLPRSAVLAARAVMYQQMKDDGVLHSDSTCTHPSGEGRSYMGKKHVTHHPEFLAAVENPAAYAFFDALFAETSRSFDYKWARAVAHKTAGTNAHCDSVYMGRGSERLHTMWVPMGDVPLANGPMCVLAQSHRSLGLEKIRNTYGHMDVDRDGIEGGFSNDPHELFELNGRHPWLSGDFAAGDVIIMGTHLIHASIRNESEYLRFTCDTRFQPASDPIDNRWVGENPEQHRVSDQKRADGKEISMENARRHWGV